MEENLLHCAATLGMAAVPVVELRGAIPFGLAFGLPADLVFLLAVVGNMLPMPFLLFFVRKVFRLLRQRPWWGEKIDRLESRAHLKGRMVRKYRILGLIILVAIPLPGTGAWTGALVATIFRIPIRKALPALLIGVLIAGAIVTAVSCGVISLWSNGPAAAHRLYGMIGGGRGRWERGGHAGFGCAGLWPWR